VVTISTRRAVNRGGVRAVAVLGRAQYEVAAGQSERVRVRLARGVARLARRGRITARTVAVSRDAAGHLVEARRNLTIRVRR
jgi:hypothetical protein